MKELTIDNSSFELYQQCPRAYFYKVIRRREANEFKSGREFGALVHKCFDYHYRGTSSLTPKEINDYYEKNAAQMYPNDHRTQGYLDTLLANYRSTYSQEPFKIVEPIDENVEVGFRLPLTIIDDVQIFWAGRIDLIVHFPSLNEYWIIDHKTHFRGGTSAFDEYVRSTPQIGYVWAARQLTAKPIKGYLINMIITRAITRTGQGIGYERQRFPVDDWMIEEWYENITIELRSLVARFKAWSEFSKLGMDSESSCPKSFHCRNKACTNKYGVCEYLNVCRVAPAQREQMLMCNLYKDYTWDPTNVD